MALIKCPECGKQISDRAASCPNCGCPIGNAPTSIKVNTLNYDGKVKRMGRSVGRTASFKKAVVKLTADSKEIEFFQGM